MAQKKIYVLMDYEGEISYETYFLIRKLLPEQEKKWLARDLMLIRDELRKENKTMPIDFSGHAILFMVPAWEERWVKAIIPNLWFENQHIHDLGYEAKIESLTL